MARAGDVLVNPPMGGRLVFLRTAEETNGELLQFDFFLKPRGVIVEEHLHPRQEERMEVISGRMRGRVGGQERVAKQGSAVVVPPGTPHGWWNGGAEEAHVVVEFRPALRTERFFETVFRLGVEGKTDERGVPRLLQRAVLMREYGDEFVPAVPAGLPLPLRKMLIGALAPIGRLLGYHA